MPGREAVSTFEGEFVSPIFPSVLGVVSGLLTYLCFRGIDLYNYGEDRSYRFLQLFSESNYELVLLVSRH